MKVKEFRGGYDSNFSYLVWDKEGVIIDASIDSERIFKFAEENDIKIRAVFIMHSHFDHLIGLEEYKGKGVEVVAHDSSSVESDIRVVDGDVLEFGGMKFKVLHTPGHLFDSICVLVENKLFTSDTLFIGAIGRCDLDGANAIDFFDSLYNKILKLDDEVEIFPGHDYGKKRLSTIKEEKESNKFLKCKSQEEFLELVGFY
ncbi:Zn-dependent hydrolase [archaeon]|nr:Zn-dependent hydrolase [archaeon]|tara:strand:+ start:2481 stop:3083 length:603 start_codon:yes stop_codon:yes gene_type:complete